MLFGFERLHTFDSVSYLCISILSFSSTQWVKSALGDPSPPNAMTQTMLIWHGLVMPQKSGICHVTQVQHKFVNDINRN